MSDEATFEPLYERWARAVAERDRGALEELFDPGYTYTSPDGQRMSREEILAVEMDVPPPGLPFRDFSVQALGDVAIVRGGHSLQGEFPGGHVRPELAARIAAGIEIAFTSVWRRRPEGWRVVSNDAHVVSDSSPRSIAAFGAGLRAGDFTAAEMTERALAAAERSQATINAFITITGGSPVRRRWRPTARSRPGRTPGRCWACRSRSRT